MYKPVVSQSIIENSKADFADFTDSDVVYQNLTIAHSSVELSIFFCLIRSC